MRHPKPLEVPSGTLPGVSPEIAKGVTTGIHPGLISGIQTGSPSGIAPSTFTPGFSSDVPPVLLLRLLGDTTQSRNTSSMKLKLALS